MNSFPSEIKFKYSWRNYQKMVLDRMDYFLHDRHLHIIAPPGSGKTVLGLEATIRLNHPTLILAPTLTIRDQWINRLCELFLQTSTIPEWISTDIRNPNFLTVITYQGLHAACNDESNVNEIVKKLKAKNINTFVLDEAHHLKNQWWNTLNEVKKKISPIIISLTATPPYDSTYSEWQRYLELNGEVDIEISVPELIREGDLCPHQDYVYFSQPTTEEFKQISKYRSNIATVYDEYSHSHLLINSFIQTDIWRNPENHLEWLYENVEVYTSYLILLLYNDIKIPKIHLQVLGLNDKDRKETKPDLLYSRLETILNYFLFQDKVFFTEYKEEKAELINKLKHKGVIEKNVINLCYNSQSTRSLVSSNSKLNSIVEIARFEHASLKDKLRMVILTDYIRDEYLAFSESEIREVKKIGVVPIFEELISKDIQTEKIGKALLKTLIKQGAIKTPENNLSIEAQTYDNGAVSCYLKGATNGEQTIFLNCLEEIIGMINNPRYIIVRKGNFQRIRKDDYHAVPSLLGVNKNFASYFQQMWKTLVGRSKLVYTRTLEGRMLLLKARIHSLSAKLEEDQKPERYRKWS